MSKALLAFVWIAGPLTGALVQPYIGICSDNCRVSWGKRKPFMIVGGAGTIVALLALAWVKEIVAGFLGIFGVDSTSAATRTTVIVLATIFMYCLDFAINTGMIVCPYSLHRPVLIFCLQFRQVFDVSLSTTLLRISRSRRMPGRAVLPGWAISLDTSLDTWICHGIFPSLGTPSSRCCAR